jgi:hypothetical protein
LNASDDFPDPDGPVTTVSCRCGMSTETFLRLWVRAPRMEMVREGMNTVEQARDGFVIPRGLLPPVYRDLQQPLPAPFASTFTSWNASK